MTSARDSGDQCRSIGSVGWGWGWRSGCRDRDVVVKTSDGIAASSTRLCVQWKEPRHTYVSSHSRLVSRCFVGPVSPCTDWGQLQYEYRWTSLGNHWLDSIVVSQRILRLTTGKLSRWRGLDGPCCRCWLSCTRVERKNSSRSLGQWRWASCRWTSRMCEAQVDEWLPHRGNEENHRPPTRTWAWSMDGNR